MRNNVELPYKYIAIILLSTLLQYSNAQSAHTYKCGHVIKTPQEIMLFNQKIENDIKVFYQWKLNKEKLKTPILDITIPVHIIIVHHPEDKYGDGANISESVVQDQIDVLNTTFAGTNDNIDYTPSVFTRGSSGIRFCLASVDPDGHVTRGITRYPTIEEYKDIESEIISNTVWPRDTYLNIYLAPNLEDRTIGYSTRPTLDSIPETDEDVIVIMTSAFGGPASASLEGYELGRVATHEIGHWFGLDHPWALGCGSDDGFEDTPLQLGPNYECPTHPSTSCDNEGDMFMNYMDYTDDACKTAFSQDQVDFMEFIIENVRSTT